MANDEKDRLGERLREKGAATETMWASKSDRALLAKLKAEVEERIARDQRERRKPRAFNRILCAIDFAPNSLLALDLARPVAMENDGQLFVFHVCPTVPVHMGGPATGAPEAEDTARKRLEEIAAKHLAGVPHEMIVLTGDATDRAHERHYDMKIDPIEA